MQHLWTSTLPGSPTLNGMPCQRPVRTYSCKGSARQTEPLTSFRIRTDAPVVELAGWFPDGPGTVLTLIVDGQLVPPTCLSASRGQGGGFVMGTVRIDFGSRQLRDVWIECQLIAAFFRVSQLDTVAAWDDTAEPSLTVIGDSYLQTTSSSFGNGGAIAYSTAARLGIRSVATDVIGGTGYWNSGGDLGNLFDRLPGHASDGAAIYLVMAGLNDHGDIRADRTLAMPTAATYEAAVLAYLLGLRATNPTAVIVVTAPFSPIPSLSDSSYGAVTATDGQVLGGFLYKAHVHRTALSAIAGPWVYIDVLMGGGWMNSAGRTGDITNLQWLTGGTPGPGTTATHKPGNTHGGAGGGFGGFAAVPIVQGGQYSQAPEITAVGGSGTGLLLSSYIEASGQLSRILIRSPGEGYDPAAGLPQIRIDNRFEISPATLGPPQPVVGVNPDGQYPLPSFAPPGATDLNNIYVYMSQDTVHPSPTGAEYLAGRLARNIFDAILAL
jgi:lysophospholipase L1-like esterase